MAQDFLRSGFVTEAEELLSGYYQLRRQHEGRQASRTTVRMLESLVRVAQAHARLMARQMVRGQARKAGWLVGACLVQNARALPVGSPAVPSHVVLMAATRCQNFSCTHSFNACCVSVSSQ